MNQSNWQIWCNSQQLSKPFWHSYARVMSHALLRLQPAEHQLVEPEKQQQQLIEEDEGEEEEEEANPEYLEFIKITRQHQAQRDKAKRDKILNDPQSNIDIYYKDISQVNTLVQDNIVEPPQRHDVGLSRDQQREQELIKLYGREQYEWIRSTEMCIDDYFKTKCQELAPVYWPAMPLNPKPYLNPV